MYIIRLHLIIDAAPDIVFKAVTTTEGYQGWWAKTCDINCNPNETSSIRFLKGAHTEEMIFRTVEIKNNEKLTWECVSNNVFSTWIGSLLYFSVAQKGKQTSFTFTQRAVDGQWKESEEYQPSLEGWEFFMQSLKRFCETGHGDAWG